MKTTLFLAVILFYFNSLPGAFAAETIACSHPELCRLANIIFTENQVKDYEFISLVKISGDPHEYEPSTNEVKSLISAKTLITGPGELNPWIKKIHYQRSKTPGTKTFTLPLDSRDYNLYPGGNHEALSHFWLYPKIFCSLKTKLEDQLVSAKLLVIKAPKKCQSEEMRIEKELTNTLAQIKKPVVLTHDALLPLLAKLGGKDATVVAIKGSGHHQEATPASVKKLYDALKAPKVIWIEEIGIKVPANILAKKRSTDITIDLDTANSEGLNYFQVLESLNTKLKAH
nr:zinc ABC transporter substrate-binding protein [Bacteriovorax sp. HI3]